MHEEKEKNNSKENKISDDKKVKIKNISIKFRQRFLINEYKHWVESVKIFPSGNIIAVYDDKSINIFDGKIIKFYKEFKMPIILEL